MAYLPQAGYLAAIPIDIFGLIKLYLNQSLKLPAHKLNDNWPSLDIMRNYEILAGEGKYLVYVNGNQVGEVPMNYPNCIPIYMRDGKVILAEFGKFAKYYVYSLDGSLIKSCRISIVSGSLQILKGYYFIDFLIINGFPCRLLYSAVDMHLVASECEDRNFKLYMDDNLMNENIDIADLEEIFKKTEAMLSNLKSHYKTQGGFKNIIVCANCIRDDNWNVIDKFPQDFASYGCVFHEDRYAVLLRSVYGAYHRMIIRDCSHILIRVYNSISHITTEIAKLAIRESPRLSQYIVFA